jgi:hypothetical protein
VLKDAKFWLGYITVFVLATLFVTGLLELTEWVAKLLKQPVNPIYLAAGGLCISRMPENGRKLRRHVRHRIGCRDVERRQTLGAAVKDEEDSFLGSFHFSTAVPISYQF